MKRLLSTFLVFVLLLGMLPTVTLIPASAAEELLSPTWEQGFYYATDAPNTSQASRKYTVIPCSEGDVFRFDIPSGEWGIWVYYGDASGAFPSSCWKEYTKDSELVIEPVSAASNRVPTELRITTFYVNDRNVAITDERWATFDITIYKSVSQGGTDTTAPTYDLFKTVTPTGATFNFPCKEEDTFTFTFADAEHILNIAYFDTDGQITGCTPTTVSATGKVVIKASGGRVPTYIEVTAAPAAGGDMTAAQWEVFDVSCIQSSNYITVASMNYGHWYNGVSQGVPNSSLESVTAKWKQMLADHDADLICGQEWIEYFDRDETVKANDHIFADRYAYQYSCGTTIYNGKHVASKTALTDMTVNNFSNGAGRQYVKGYTTINDKKVCIINAHLSFDNPGVNRTAEIQELISVMNNEDYVILAGDFNVYEVTEFQLFTDAGYTVANGGEFGEFETWPNFGNTSSAYPNKCIDNIIVSPNIAMLNVECDRRDLSDHAMLVAELQLLDASEVIEIGSEAEWKEWFDGGDNSKIINRPGTVHKVKLTADVTITGNARVYYVGSSTKQCSIELDLGGHTLTYSDSSTRFLGIYNANSTLTISNGTVVNTAAITAADGAMVFVLRGNLVVNDVNFIDNTTHSYTASGKLFSFRENTTGSFTNVDIQVNTTNNTNVGGVFNVVKTAQLTMTDCSVTASQTSNMRLGGILYNAGTAKLIRTTFTGGSTTNTTNNGGNGGAIYSNNILTLEDSTVTGGNAVNGGGNICQNGGTLTLTGGSVTGGEAGTDGGNLMITGNGELILGNCAVTGGEAGGNGQNICIVEGAKLQVTEDLAKTASVYVPTTWIPAEVYGGELSTGYASSTGAFPGKLTLEGVDGEPALYGVNGKLVIAGASIVKDGVQTWYQDNNAAMSDAAADDQACIKLYTASGLTLPSGSSYTVDLNGQEMVTITGSGSVTCYDSSNAASGYQTYTKVTVGPDVTIANALVETAPDGQRYVKVKESEDTENNTTTYSFHAFDLSVKSVSIVPNADSSSMYYKGVWKGDDILKNKAIQSFGIIVSAKDLPGDDFRTEVEGTIDGEPANYNRYSEFRAADFANGVVKTGVEITEIMKTDLTNEANAYRGSQIKIYAAAYYTFSDGTETVTVTVPVVNDGYSLYDVMNLIDNNDTTYNALQAKIDPFYTTWKNSMDLWFSGYTYNETAYEGLTDTFTNIKAVTTPAEV